MTSSILILQLWILWNIEMILMKYAAAVALQYNMTKRAVKDS